MKRKIRIAAALIAAFGLGLSACGGGDGNNGAANTREPDNAAPADGAAAQVEAVYKANCVSCHGADLGGGFGPELKNADERLSADELFAVIKDGRGQMPAFGGTLSDDEIRALVEWMRAQ